MGKPRAGYEIGTGWIAAIVALALLLVIGMALYFRMSAPLSEHRHALGHWCVPAAQSQHRSPHHIVLVRWFPRDRFLLLVGRFA